MNTTLIFAELLIIGLEGGIWLSFTLLSILGINGLDKFFAAIKDWQPMVLALVLPLLYVFGIVLDRIADILFKSAERKINQKVVGDLPVTIPVMRFSLGIENNFLNQQLEYTRTRMRIVRASSVNFVFIAISISIFILNRLTNIPLGQRWQYIALTMILGLLVSWAALIAWRYLVKGHLQLSKTMFEYQYQRPRKKKTSNKN